MRSDLEKKKKKKKKKVSMHLANDRNAWKSFKRNSPTYANMENAKTNMIIMMIQNFIIHMCFILLNFPKRHEKG